MRIFLSKIIPMFGKKFVTIDEVMINTDVLTTKFHCDLAKCKGACCTIEGPNGAPLLEEELPKMEKNLKIALSYLPKEHLDVIAKKGWHRRNMGSYYTSVYRDRACVFVYYEGDIAKCAYEKAYFEGKSDFRKPVSCHLFPIRISNFGGEIVRYERSDVCRPALEKGNEEGTQLLDFCKEAITRYYGEKWFTKLKEIKVK